MVAKMGHLRKLPNSVLRDCHSSASCLEDQKKMWTFVKHEAFSSARSIKVQIAFHLLEGRGKFGK